MYSFHVARQFRLVHDNLEPAVFFASRSTFKNQLNSAFADFFLRNNFRSVVLEVYHHQHAWQQVYDAESKYQIISNPFLLNYSKLFDNAVYTLLKCDTWPSEQQKLEDQRKRRIKEREELAQARRRSFIMISSET